MMRIAISGKMASGKTTIRRYLELNYGFIGYSFASPIKKLEKIHAQVHPASWLAEIKHFVEDLVPEREYKHLTQEKRQELTSVFKNAFSNHKPMPGLKNRGLLQEIGSNARNVEPNIWLNYTLGKAIYNDFVVIDDIRYVNEVEAAKTLGFQIWRLDVIEEIQKSRVKSLYGESSLSKMDHISEVDLDYRFELFDYMIDANGSLEEMYSSVDLILELSGVKAKGVT